MRPAYAASDPPRSDEGRAAAAVLLRRPVLGRPAPSIRRRTPQRERSLPRSAPPGRPAPDIGRRTPQREGSSDTPRDSPGPGRLGPRGGVSRGTLPAIGNRRLPWTDGATRTHPQVRASAPGPPLRRRGDEAPRPPLPAAHPSRPPQRAAVPDDARGRGLGSRAPRGDRAVGPRARLEPAANVLAGGAVEIRIARLRFTPRFRSPATAEAVGVLADCERRNRMIAPVLRRVLSRLAGFRCDGRPAAGRHRLVEALPLLAFSPIDAEPA